MWMELPFEEEGTVVFVVVRGLMGSSGQGDRARA